MRCSGCACHASWRGSRNPFGQGARAPARIPGGTIVPMKARVPGRRGRRLSSMELQSPEQPSGPQQLSGRAVEMQGLRVAGVTVQHHRDLAARSAGAGQALRRIHDPVVEQDGVSGGATPRFAFHYGPVEGQPSTGPPQPVFAAGSRSSFAGLPVNEALQTVAWRALTVRSMADATRPSTPRRSRSICRSRSSSC